MTGKLPFIAIFVLLVLFTPGFAYLANFSAPAEKELGEIYTLSVEAYDPSSNPLNNTPCQVYVSANNGEIINYFKPDVTTKTLYTDGTGLLIYGFKLISDIYQVDNTYNVTVACPYGKVTQEFTTLTAKTPNKAFNLLFFIKDNAPYILVAVLLLLIFFLELDKWIGVEKARLFKFIVLVVLLLAIVLVGVFW